jgi:hypothetical protein
MDNQIRQPVPAFFAKWFQPTQGRIGPESVNNLDELRRLLAQLSEYERVYVVLARDRGARGSITLHVTDNRVGICHADMLPGGIFSFCHDPEEKGPDNKIVIVGSHAQVDSIHRSWTVPRQQGHQALEYFLLHGERDPGLNWVEQQRGQILSLERERAEPGSPPDVGFPRRVAPRATPAGELGRYTVNHF